MHSRRFDLLTRAIGRRGLLASALALASNGHTPLPPALAGGGPTGCAKRGAGTRCRKNGQCCSGRCKKKKGKRKGKCRCSELRKPCRENTECCGHSDSDLDSPRCDSKAGVQTLICCIGPLGPCTSSADCCLEGECVEGSCEPDCTFC
ncbi:MAG: hypothetical protein ACRDJC_20700 [Thermomicrobiales bacterium]